MKTLMFVAVFAALCGTSFGADCRVIVERHRDTKVVKKTVSRCECGCNRRGCKCEGKCRAVTKVK